MKANKYYINPCCDTIDGVEPGQLIKTYKSIMGYLCAYIYDYTDKGHGTVYGTTDAWSQDRTTEIKHGYQFTELTDKQANLIINARDLLARLNN